MKYMKKWESILILSDTTVIETMQIIDESSLQFAAVVDERNCLLGTVTDGDIRRGILSGITLDSKIELVMNTSPLVERVGKNIEAYHMLMKEKKLKQLPIVTADNQIHEILFLEHLSYVSPKNNTVVLMVGGLGTRLYPLTEHSPKPMLKVGEKPILQTIIESFKSFGFTNFIFSVNYKKEIIKDYFQDGSEFGVKIEYIEENKRMGTAGALSLIKEKLTDTFFVMNGDLLTKINYEQLLDFHEKNNSQATMCVREYEYQIPYGVIEIDNHCLLNIEEKPVHKEFVNAGIYTLNPNVLQYIPEDQFFDMPNLFKKIVEMNNQDVAVFPVREYWLDIGRIDDYEKAKGDYVGVFL